MRLLMLGLCLFTAAAQDDKAKSPFARWEKAIAAMEKADKEKPPPEGAVFFCGSSSMVRWDLKKSFPKLPVVNRGFGGSQVADSTHFAGRIILPHKPAVIVFYAGDNDIAAGKSAEKVRDDFKAFVKAVHDKLPRARVLYLAIKPSPKRWALVGEMRKANGLIEAVCKGDRRLEYVDVASPMLGEDGKPRAELYVKDELHLSEKGYELWTGIVAKRLAAK